jgi:suppressor for copper-sensitivity B
MRRVLRLALPFLIFAAIPPAVAASQAEVEGAQIALHAMMVDGTLRAALEIVLEPGWKTYWIAPGAAGLAPRIDLSASTGVRATNLSFPVPARFLEGDLESIGYVDPVSIAIAAETVAGEQPVLRADLLLGLCRELCLPVRLQLEAEPASSLGARAAVRRAFDALPIPAASAENWRAALAGGASRLTIQGPPEALDRAKDLFVSASDGWAFGKPALTRLGPDLQAEIPILSRPGAGAMLQRIDLVLTDGEKGELIRALPVERR